MNQNFIIIMNQKCQIYSIKIYVRKKNTKFTTKFTWGKETPNLQHQNLREKSWEKICQIYNINIYMRKKRQIYNIKICVGKTKTPNLQHQNLRAKKKPPNLQHQNLREKKTAKFTTSKFTWEKTRQIYNMKIYVRKKTAKFTTSKFTWEKKTPN